MDALLNKILMRGADDWVMACEVVSVAKAEGGASTEAEIRDLSIRLIRQLIKRGLVEIGDVTETGFRPWNLPVEEAMMRVERDWRMLQRSPSLGDVCWLQNTPEGDSRAKLLLADGTDTKEGATARRRPERMKP